MSNSSSCLGGGAGGAVFVAVVDCIEPSVLLTVPTSGKTQNARVNSLSGQ